MKISGMKSAKFIPIWLKTAPNRSGRGLGLQGGLIQTPSGFKTPFGEALPPGRAPDPLVWDLGRSEVRKLVIRVNVDLASLPGPPGFLNSSWIQVHAGHTLLGAGLANVGQLRLAKVRIGQSRSQPICCGVRVCDDVCVVCVFGVC